MSSKNPSKKPSGTKFRKSARYNGKSYSAYGSTAKEAQQKLQQKLDALKQGVDVSGGNMTVDAWFDKWFETYRIPKGICQPVLKRQESMYRRLVSPSIGLMKLCNVRDIHLQKILNSQAGMSSDHISKLAILLRSMFSKAHTSRLILFDPSASLEKPSGTSGSHRSLTDEEQDAFLTVARTHPRGAWIQTLLYTGMRPGESATLVWNDVDFERNEIHIHTARAAGTTEIKAPKTDAGSRDIPMVSELVNILRPLKGPPFSLVFPGPSGSIASKCTMYSWWSSFTRSVNIYLGAETTPRGRIKGHKLADDLTVYCLRHTFCTNCEKNGVPIDIAKRYMGHSNISTTANIYTHNDSDTLHRYMKLMERPSIPEAAQK